jgi:hypothetical protein
MVSNDFTSRGVLLHNKNRVRKNREDIALLLLAKMEQIAHQTDRPFHMAVEEVTDTNERARNVVRGLVGIIVQYAETRAGFLALCQHLVQKLQNEQWETLPGEVETKY